MREPTEILIERYKDALFAAAFHICKNSADADDAGEEPVWLLKGMHDQGVETGNPEYDNR